MPDYITEHHGGGWKYQFHIPVELRSLFKNSKGKPAAAFIEYLPRMPKRAALEEARRLAVRDAARLAEARKMDPRHRAIISETGGIATVVGGLKPYLKEEQRQRLYWADRGALDAVKQVDKAGETAKIVSEYSWDRLFLEWKRAKNPTRTRDHLVTIELLKNYLGDCNLRDKEEMNSHKIAMFRDHLLTTDTTPGMVEARLGHIKAMFAGAAKDPTSPFHGMPNHARGVGVMGERPAKMPSLPFSPAQVRMILDTAALTGFGDTRKSNRHPEAWWALRLWAHTGARPNEILQLQGGDVAEENGVRFLRIRKIDAITGKRHPHKSVKTGETRVIPLHSDVLGFFDYAASYPRDAFIFAAFDWNENSYRIKWIADNFGDLLEKAKVICDDPNGHFSPYSFRHTFKAAMRRARTEPEIQNRLMGHRLSVHEGYGGTDLVLLRDSVNQLTITE